jgi:hypothetical protein
MIKDEEGKESESKSIKIKLEPGQEIESPQGELSTLLCNWEWLGAEYLDSP